MAAFLKLDSVNGILVLCVGFFPLFTLSMLRGGLQGGQRFVALASLRVLEPAVQLALGLGLVAMGFGAAGAVGGTVLAFFACGAIAWKLLRPSFEKPPDPAARGTADRSNFTRIGLFVFMISAFFNIDVLFAKHRFGLDEAAAYTAASFLSRILFLSALSIGMALLPKAIQDRENGGRTLLFRSLAYFWSFAVPFALICSLVPGRVVKLFFGSQYLEAAGLLPPLLFAHVMIGTAFLIGIRRISGAGRSPWPPFALAVTLEAIGLAFATGPIQVAWILAGSSAALLAFSFRKTAAEGR